MPAFDDSTVSAAAPQDVWLMLYDPLRFPLWWTGIETAVAGDAKGGTADVTVYPDGYPDFPMPQFVRSRPEDRRITVSCTVSELVFDWRLEPVPDGTRISVHVEIPDAEAHRLAAQREVISTSLRRLADLAAPGHL